MDNIPKLRFPEFKGEWEEKRLGECLTLLYGKDWKDKSSTKKLYPVLGTGGVISYIDEFIYDKPCVLIGRKGSINNPVFIDKPFWTVDTQFYSEIHEGYSPKFLYYIFCTENWSKHDESTGVPSLSAKNVENTHKHIPSYSEQQKIADFLSNVDSIITAETKILNTLQKKKKALMQKLFTRQLRFKSDDGTDFPAWEEKKLEECVKKVCVGFVGVCEQFYTDKSGIPMYRTGNLKNGKVNKLDLKYVTKEFHEKNIKSQLQKYDILIARHGENGQASLYNYDEQANCLNIVIVRPNEELAFHNYLINCINSDFVRKEVSRKTAGSTQSVINTKAIEGLIIPIPCKAEQQKIADCLSSIDSLIQTQQKVVTTWQHRKKALLQQMFV